MDERPRAGYDQSEHYVAREGGTALPAAIARASLGMVHPGWSIATKAEGCSSTTQENKYVPILATGEEKKK